MTRLRIPKVMPKPKDFSKTPWTEEFRSKFPTHAVEKYLDNGIAEEDLRDFLFAEKHLDFRKSLVLVEALKNERGIVRNDNEILLTINLPFCEWRCVNCKRTMYQRSKCTDAFMYYFDALMKEIQFTREIIKKKCYLVKAVCFTGNLLALDEPEIAKILEACTYTLSEICAELGNPKFITKSKLEILKKYNVNRIIVNALTFNTVSLRKLCRRYEFKDIYEHYKLIAEFGFDLSIELGVGVQNEHEIQLGRNIQLAIELGASCIDFYSRYCPYSVDNNELTDIKAICEQRKLLEFVNETMQKHGYVPYFLYCTEVENGCFENIGYCLPNKRCKYMEDLREEISTIIGCGTDAKTTIVNNLRHTRKSMTNTYDLGQYVFGIEQVLDKKQKFFEQKSLQND